MSPGFLHPPLPIHFSWLAHCVHLLPASKLSLQSLFRLWLNYLHIFERNLSGDRCPQPLPITTFLPPLLPPLCLISTASPVTLSRLSFFCFTHAKASPNWQNPHLLFPPPQILCPWTQSFWWMNECLHEWMNLLLTLLPFGTLILWLTSWTWLSFSNLLFESSFLWLPLNHVAIYSRWFPSSSLSMQSVLSVAAAVGVLEVSPSRDSHQLLLLSLGGICMPPPWTPLQTGTSQSCPFPPERFPS